LGRTTTITYHAGSGKPAAITAPDNSTTTFAYVSRVVSGITLFDLQKITFPDGTNRSFTYDANGNLLTAVDPLGHTAAFTYDAHGQVLTITNSRGGVATFTYDAGGRLLTSRDADTADTTYTYDALGRLTRAASADGAHLDVAYDAADKITALADERGNSYAFAYDANGNLTGITDPNAANVQFGYDALDRLNQLVDRFGKTRTRTFDARDDIATETDELNHTTTFSHDTRRRISAIADPGNAPVQFGYDDEAELISLTDPLGHTTSLGRNLRGQVIALTDPLGHAVNAARDSLQRITSVTDELGRTSTFAFNAAGALTAVSREGAGMATYAYDTDDNLTRISDPRGGVWDYTYTPSGLFSSAKDPLGRMTSYSYDNLGRLSSLGLPEGGTCAIERDAADNITRMLYTDGTDLLFAYDALDRVLSANDVAVTRDAAGRIIGATSGGVISGATYDAAGRLTSVSYHNGAVLVSYTYDVNDRLVSVSDNISNATVAFARDAAGRVVSVTRSNGVNATLTYDAADRLTRIQDGAFLDLQYTLNAAGEVVSLDLTAPVLPSVTADAKQFSYNAANEVAAAGYAYDQRGRLTASPGHTFTWDAASRLTQIDTTTLGYDGFGDLVTRSSGGATTRYLHHPAIDGRPIVAERNEGNAQFTRFYVWMPGGVLLYSIDAITNAVSFYHYDRVGSTLALTDTTGTVTDAYAYSPYGEVLARTGTASQPFTFVGAFGTRAEGSFYQMRLRYYDPVTARFLSRDPGSANLRDVRTLDPYTYALGNPMTYIDRTGGVPLRVFDSALGPNDVKATSLFGNTADETSARERFGAALAFGSEGQIVATGLGLAVSGELSETPEVETKLVEPPNIELGSSRSKPVPTKGDDFSGEAQGGGIFTTDRHVDLVVHTVPSSSRGFPPMTADSVVADQQNLVSNRDDQDQKTPGPKSKGPLQLFKKFVKKALALQQAQKEQAEKDAKAKEKAEKKQKKEEAKKAKEDKKKFEENKEKYKKEFGGGTKE
jgi:RHS repeat-associated protein